MKFLIRQHYKVYLGEQVAIKTIFCFKVKYDKERI